MTNRAVVTNYSVRLIAVNFVLRDFENQQGCKEEYFNVFMGLLTGNGSWNDYFCDPCSGLGPPIDATQRLSFLDPQLHPILFFVRAEICFFGLIFLTMIEVATHDILHHKQVVSWFADSHQSLQFPTRRVQVRLMAVDRRRSVIWSMKFEEGVPQHVQIKLKRHQKKRKVEYVFQRE